MSAYLWRVTAKRAATSKIAVGIWVEIVVNNSSRKPIQKEVIDALNAKYGAGTALNGLSLTNFDMVKVS